MSDKSEFLSADYLQDAFAFFTDVIVPSLETSVDPERFKLVVHEAPDFRASIIAGESRFQIMINEGVANGIAHFCQTYADLENPLLKSHIAELDDVIGDHDRALSVSFYAGLLFLILHEFSHVAAGHVAFTLHSEDSFEEGAQWSIAELRRMAELEADGMALALLFEFKDEFCTTLEIAPEQGSEQREALSRGILLGVVSAVSLLEGMFARETAIEGSYPYPAVRLLNLCSAFLRSVVPDIAIWRDGDYRVNRQQEEAIETISEHFKRTIAPTLFILHDALGELNIPSQLHSIADDPDNIQGFMEDALLILGGSTPHHSVDGRELAKLSEGRSHFLKALAPFRELDLWHAFDEP